MGGTTPRSGGTRCEGATIEGYPDRRHRSFRARLHPPGWRGRYRLRQGMDHRHRHASPNATHPDGDVHTAHVIEAAEAQSATSERAIAAGFAAVLCKPFHLHDRVSTVECVVGAAEQPDWSIGLPFLSAMGISDAHVYHRRSASAQQRWPPTMFGNG